MDKLSPRLTRVLSSPPHPDAIEMLPLVLHLSAQVDLARLTGAPAFDALTRPERRRRVVAALDAVAASQQARLAPVLDDLARRGRIGPWHGLTVVNRIVTRAAPSAVDTLARRPEVARIDLALRGAGPSLQARRDGATTRTAERISWGVTAIGATSAWADGLSGRGVVVGILDSGASAVHRQLQPNYTGLWYDAAGLSSRPVDRAYGHGSGVLSAAVGANLDGIVLGVAPGARWLACAAFPDGRFHEELLLRCADWMLTTAQPDVLINAWLLPADGDPCDPRLRPVVQAWRAAEILPLFAAGNLGGGPGVNRAPANHAGLAPDGGAVLAVGGLARSGAPLADSARGPNRCAESVFPSLVAPGEELITALPVTPDAYLDATGTSYATGLAAGAAALLYERFPGARVSRVEAALRRGAADLGPPGPDPQSGHGRLDLPGALDALEHLTAPGRTGGPTAPIPAISGRRSSPE